VIDREVKTDDEARLLAEGFLDGAEITLKLVLGEQPIPGAAPYTGERTPELEAWAAQALAEIALIRSVDIADMIGYTEPDA
jgi:hypothetical protein